jgi:hypothetical protein
LSDVGHSDNGQDEQGGGMDVLLRRATPQARALGAVAVSYAVLALVLAGRVRFGQDETVYLSQVAHLPDAFFSAPRARGITWLAAPVAMFTTNLWAIRIYFAVLAGVWLALAFRPWLRLRDGYVIPLAAAIFALLWPALFYAGEAMPNLWVAFAAVSAVGWFLRAVREPTARLPLVAMGASIVIAALFRPPDGVWLALALVGAALIVRRWRRPVLIGTSIAAIVIGVAPWVIEAYISYGGPIRRLHRASVIEGGTHLQVNVVNVLRSVDGGTLCRPCTHPVPPDGAALWMLGLIVIVIGVVAVRKFAHRDTTWLAVGVACAVATPYLWLIDYSAPRFLLPAYALCSIALADGALALRRWFIRHVNRHAANQALAGFLVLLAGYQAVLTLHVAHSATDQRNGWERLVTVLKQDGVRPPCLLAGDDATPVAFYDGCASRQFVGHDRELTAPQFHALSTREPAAILVRRNDVTIPRFAVTWQPVKLRAGGADWKVYLAPHA